jgi:hypothetical protein
VIDYEAMIDKDALCQEIFDKLLNEMKSELFPTREVEPAKNSSQKKEDRIPVYRRPIKDRETTEDKT